MFPVVIVRSNVSFVELDCVPRRPDSPAWDNGPFLSSPVQEASDSVPSLEPLSSSEEWSPGGWDVESRCPGFVEEMVWAQPTGDVEEFERDVDQSLLLEGVECDLGESLLGFVDDVVVRRRDGLELLSQVAVRSAGPPGLAGVSVKNPICIE
jgi:hypothetical protein